MNFIAALSAFSFSNLNSVCLYAFTDNGLLNYRGKNLEACYVYCVVFQKDDLAWRAPKEYFAELHYIKHTMGVERFHHSLE
jgi:hypothetical protein